MDVRRRPTTGQDTDLDHREQAARVPAIDQHAVGIPRGGECGRAFRAEDCGLRREGGGGKRRHA